MFQIGISLIVLNALHHMRRQMNKKMSKSRIKRENQKINSQIIRKFSEKTLDEDRKDADIKEKNNDFNPKDFINALNNSGVNTKDSVFSDMERMLNSNEAIRELVDIKNIRMKTKVTDEQHKIIVILYGSYKSLLTRYGIDFKGLRTILDEFIEIAPSIEGKRAEQYVTAHQAVAQALANAHLNPNAIRDNSDIKQ